MLKAVLLVFIFMVGCASTGVVPLSQDVYYVGKKDGSIGTGVSLGNKVAVYKEANAFCARKKKEVKVLTENVQPSRPGQLGLTELQFKCVVAGGEGSALVPRADTVIEINDKRRKK